MVDDDFQRLQTALAAAGIPFQTAEAHGLLCGILCGGIAEPIRRWRDELLQEGGDLTPELKAMAKQAQAALDDPDLGFAPLLPGELAPLSQRAQGVAEWCQGFLYGFGIGGSARDRVLPRQSQEALRDIAEITRLDAAALADMPADGQEDEERELAELSEFLRVAVLLVREERLTSKQQQKAMRKP